MAQLLLAPHIHRLLLNVNRLRQLCLEWLKGAVHYLIIMLHLHLLLMHHHRILAALELAHLRLLKLAIVADMEIHGKLFYLSIF